MIIGCIWIISLLLASPMIAFTSVSHGTIRADASVCSSSTMDSQTILQAKLIHGRITLIVQYLVPMSIVGYAYTRIYWKIRSRQNFRKKVQHNENATTAPMQSVPEETLYSAKNSRFETEMLSNCVTDALPELTAIDPEAATAKTMRVHQHKQGHLSNRLIAKIHRLRKRAGRDHSERDRHIRRRQAKTNALLLAITVTFILSWTPLHVFTLIMDSAELRSSDNLNQRYLTRTEVFQLPTADLNDNHSTVDPSVIPSTVIGRSKDYYLSGRFVTLINAICLLCVNLTACINPILYGWLNENFHKEFKQMFVRCFR
ncbi:uncharacterized protein DEA37_0002183 [Paragonimus westermani]|uniref:G-protein coupled receptors family 1 profile domain-containing protein n=1 Tax=Paragonimus westermani TaxID=34504 RepID=A0A5J4P1C1_9TREM|nr:uncharacterized protein DEA37_0002183 [Paragonimus westermani]